jgi:hypothetical protein
VLDYVAAAALIALPFLLGFQGIELWLSVAGGAGLIAYSLLTDCGSACKKNPVMGVIGV